MVPKVIARLLLVSSHKFSLLTLAFVPRYECQKQRLQARQTESVSFAFTYETLSSHVRGTMDKAY